jgi:general stress protein 26
MARRVLSGTVRAKPAFAHHTKMEDTMSEDVTQVWSAIERQPICMLSDHDGGAIRARPMAAFPDRDEGIVWFVTDRRSAKEEEIKRDDRVGLAFADLKANTYLSLSGHARLVDDRDKLRDLWTEMVDAWFPKGPDDPNAVLLCVDPDQAEIWDSPADRRVVRMKVEEAQREDRRPDLGRNAKVAM